MHFPIFSSFSKLVAFLGSWSFPPPSDPAVQYLQISLCFYCHIGSQTYSFSVGKSIQSWGREGHFESSVLSATQNTSAPVTVFLEGELANTIH